MTEPLDRRQFFARATLFGGALALPGWAARAFFPQDPQNPQAPTERVKALREALAKARKRARPVLVIVVPTDDDLVWSRGAELGALLNFATEATLLDLALVEPVCAALDEVEGVVRQRVAPGAHFVLIETTPGGAARTTPIEPDLTKLPVAPAMDQAKSYEAWLASHETLQREINARYHAALHRAIAADPAALAAHADAVRSTLTDEERHAIDACISGDAELPKSLALEAAAVLRLAAVAPRRDGDIERLHGLVVAAARSVFVGQRIPGSRWAHTSGCGVTIEGETEDGALMIACGMGAVPPMSSRFLHFLANG